MKWFRLACAILAGCAGPRTAEAADDGGTQSPFVLGIGAREQAMGRTGAATSASPDALFWNPARLGNVQWPELSAFRMQLFVDDALYQSGLFAYPTLDLGTLAIGYQRIGVSDIERTDERNTMLGAFENNESSLLLGYGRAVGSFVSVGGGLRIAQQSVDSASDVGVGLDLGIAVDYGLDSQGVHRLGLGTNLQNAVEPKLRLVDEEVEDPRNLKLGLGYSGAWLRRRLSWVAAIDADFPERANPRLGAGWEVSWAQLLSLRAGIDDAQPTFGLGVSYRNLRFDYGLRSEDNLSQHGRFTLALRFGASASARREARLVERQRLVSDELSRRLRELEMEEHARARTQADAAFQGRNFEEALRLYRRVLALDPDDHHASARADAAQLQMRLADAGSALQSGNAAQAATAYQAILERWPADASARQGLDAARAQLRQSADRERTLRELFREALSRFTAGDLPTAETTLQELLRLAPTHEPSRELLESVRTTRQQKGAAEHAKARALAQAGDFDAALQALRAAKRQLGRRDDLDALESQWEARRAEAAARQLASVQAPADQEDRAPRAASPRRHSVEERADLDKRYREGLAAFKRGEFERAIRQWRAVWLEDPDFQGVGDHLIQAYLFEGVELYSSGNYEAALDRCQRVLEIEPGNEKARRYLGRIREEKLELEEIRDGRVEQ